MWDSIKITPVNPSVVFALRNKSFLTRKIGGFAVRYIIRFTHSKVTLNPRYYENTFVLNSLNTLLPKGSKVLDVGSAESEFPLYLHASGYKVIPFDQRKFPFLDSVQGDALKLNTYFPDGSMDAITVISTIEHIGLGVYGDTLEKVTYLSLLNQWKTLLKKGGILLLTLPVTAMESRREPGQWVVSLSSLKQTLKETQGVILGERLVIENPALAHGWEEFPVDGQRSFNTGVYMCTIQY
jgi:hypothetical protein